MRNTRPENIKSILTSFSLLHTSAEEVAMRKWLFALMSDAEIEEFRRSLTTDIKAMEKMSA